MRSVCFAGTTLAAPRPDGPSSGGGAQHPGVDRPLVPLRESWRAASRGCRSAATTRPRSVMSTVSPFSTSRTCPLRRSPSSRIPTVLMRLLWSHEATSQPAGADEAHGAPATRLRGTKRPHAPSSSPASPARRETTEALPTLVRWGVRKKGPVPIRPVPLAVLVSQRCLSSPGP